MIYMHSHIYNKIIIVFFSNYIIVLNSTMEKGNALPFPYEFEDIKAEENEYLEKIYKCKYVHEALSRGSVFARYKLSWLLVYNFHFFHFVY